MVIRGLGVSRGPSISPASGTAHGLHRDAGECRLSDRDPSIGSADNLIVGSRSVGGSAGQDREDDALQRALEHLGDLLAHRTPPRTTQRY